jgi:hypothetical protein
MVFAFSFCLYGPENPLYYNGMLDNICLAGIYFPTWKVYVYVGSDVPEPFIERMEACTNVVIRRTGMTGSKNMIQRFYAIDEPDVEIMMVRDADSRIHWRDRWCIREFLKTDLDAHNIRDNREHTAKIMGGLWGLRKTAGICMRKEYESYVEDTSLGWRHAHDQNFLGDVIYPKIVDRMLVHYTNGRVRLGEKHAVEIPFQWSNECFCGLTQHVFVDYPEPPLKPKPFSAVSSIKGPVPNMINFLNTK